MKTKEIVFTKPYTAELWDSTVRPPRAGEVTVELAYSAISAGTEKANYIGARNGVHVAEDSEPIYPRVVGYSAAGIVSEVGEGVADLAVGDRVVVFWGTHRGRITINRDSVMRIPEGVPTEEAAMAFIATFPMAAIRKTRLEIGESALVMGLGILGVLGVCELRAAGAYPIIAADPLASRRALAMKMGADYALDPTEEGFSEEVKRLTGGGANVCIEVTGLGAGLQGALECMKEMGRVALLGCTRSSKFEIDYYGKVHGRGISLIGAHTMARPKLESAATLFTERDDLACVLSLLAGGRLSFAPMIEELASPLDAQAVYTRLVSEKAPPVGILFDWTHIGGEEKK